MSRSFKPTYYGGQAARYKMTTDNRRARRQANYLNKRAIVVTNTPSEVKSSDVFVNDLATDILDNNATIFLLNGLNSDTSSSGRIGAKIKMKALRCRGEVALEFVTDGQGSQLLPNIVRLSIVYDKTPAGAIPKWNEIFSDFDTDGFQVGRFYSGRNPFNKHRFTVLKEKFIALNPPFKQDSHNVATSAPFYKEFFDMYVKIGREAMYTKSATDTAASISGGALYLCVKSNYNTLFSRVRCVADNRLTYYDE